MKLNVINEAVHFTHNDADAVGCELVYRLMVLKHFHIKDENAKTFFCSNGDIDKKFKNYMEDLFSRNEVPEFIIISDNCISVETYNWFKEKTALVAHEIGFYGYDHHKTNPFIDKKYPLWLVEDGDESAAYIMYDFYKDVLCIDKRVSHIYESNPNEEHKKDIDYGNSYAQRIGEIINAISRYDTWAWRTDPVDNPVIKEDLIAKITDIADPEGTSKLLLDFYRYDDSNYYHQYYPKYFDVLYNGIKEKEKDTIDKTLGTVRIINFLNYRTAVFIGNNYFNETCEAIYKDNPNIDIVLVLFLGDNVISLRSDTRKENEVDVSVIAKKFGGGGHPNAAGSRIGRDLFEFIFRCTFDPDYSMTYIDYISNLESFNKLKKI